MKFTQEFTDCVYEIYENGICKQNMIEIRRVLVNRLPVKNILYKTNVLLIKTKYNTYLVKNKLPFRRGVDGLIDREFVYNQIRNLKFMTIRQTDLEKLLTHKSSKHGLIDYYSAFDKINELVPYGVNVIFEMDSEANLL